MAVRDSWLLSFGALAVADRSSVDERVSRRSTGFPASFPEEEFAESLAVAAGRRGRRRVLRWAAACGSTRLPFLSRSWPSINNLIASLEALRENDLSAFGKVYFDRLRHDIMWSGVFCASGCQQFRMQRLLYPFPLPPLRVAAFASCSSLGGSPSRSTYTKLP